MNWVVAMLLGNTAVAVALAAAALAASWLRRPALAHALWLLTMIKLVTPAIVHVPVNLPGGRTTPVVAAAPSASGDASAVATVQSAIGDASAVADMNDHRAVQTSALHVVKSVGAQPSFQRDATRDAHAESLPSTKTPPFIAKKPGSWGAIALLTWAGGAALLLSITVIRLQRFRRLLGCAEPADAVTSARLRDVAARVGINRVPPLRVLRGCRAPMVFGLAHPVVIVPESFVTALSPARQETVLLHELAHLRRGDQWSRLLELAVTSLLWWHPLAWIARSGLREAEEQCCDAWVVAILPDCRRNYADALVDVLTWSGPARDALPAGATGLGRITHVRRRLTMILDQSPDRSLSVIGKMFVATLAGLLMLMPVRAAETAIAETARNSSTSKPATASSQPGAVAVDDSTRKAVESLLEMMQEEDPQVRGAAAEAIVRFGSKAVPVLIDALQHDKAAPLAQSVLRRMSVAAAEALIDAVGSPSATVRERALLTLEVIVSPTLNLGDPAGVPGEGAAPGAAPVGPVGPGGFGGAGFSGSGGGGGGGSGFGGGGFGGGGVAAPPSPFQVSVASWVVPVAAKASTDSSPAVRRAAIRVIGTASHISYDPSVAAALASALAVALKDQDPTVRQLAAKASISVAPIAPSLTTALTTAVNDSDQAVREFALIAIGSAGSSAKAAMPTVTAALKDQNPAVRIAAANTLGAMQEPPRGSEQVGSIEGMGGMPVAGAPWPSEGVLVIAQNIWHWSSTGRLDLAKAEADRMLNAHAEPEAMLNAFQTVATWRDENLSTWLGQMKNVKELSGIVGQLNQAIAHPATQNAATGEGGLGGAPGGPEK